MLRPLTLGLFAYPLIFLFCILFSTSNSAQTALSPGDIGFIGYNADGGTEDNFSFILLKDIDAGTEIFFTDLGWTGTAFQSTPATCGANNGSAGDGVIRWTATSALTCGTEIYIFASTNLSANSGNVTGIQATFNDNTKYINLPSGGDQVFAYQGSLASPSFIAGIYMNSPAWDPVSACEFTSSKSSLPSALAGIGFAIDPEVDNAEYNCAINSGTVASLRSAILNVNNWTQNNSTPFTFPVNCNFVCNQNAPVITMQPTDVDICPNLPATFSLTANNATSYQWEINTGSGFVNASGGNFSGATSTTLTVNNITGLNGALFRCQVSGTGGTTTSEVASLTEIFNPSIVKQPVDASSCQGCMSGFLVEAEGENLVYQWKISTGGSFSNLSNDATYAGVNSPRLEISNIPSALNGAMFKCEVSGTCIPSIETDPKALTLDGANTTLIAGDLAFIAYNVDDSDPAQEDNFSFVLLKDIDAGTEISITDFGWANNNAFHETCSGTESASDGIIKWVATSSLTCGSEIFINGKSSLTTNTGIVFGVQTAVSFPDQYLPFSSGGDQLFAYQGTHLNPTLLAGIYFANDAGWDASFLPCGQGDGSSTKSILPAALTPGFSAIAITPEVDNAKYSCAITSGATTSIRAALLSVANWDVDNTTPFPLPVACNIGCNESAPNITMQPIPVDVCEGDATSLSITAVNATSYQWQNLANGNWGNISDGVVFSGVTTDMLTITTNVGFPSSDFRCIASNTMGNSTSLSALVTIKYSPTIINQPVNAVSCVGCNSGFSTVVTGDNLMYQWQLSTNGGASYSTITNDATYAGATSPNLTLSNISSALDGHLYRCVISGDCTPSVTTNGASLSLSGANQTLAQGDLAFVAFNADDDQEAFSFVLLTTVLGGTEINITDFGWTNDNAFQNCSGSGTGDGIIKWVATENYPCGTEIAIDGKTLLAANKGAVIGVQATVADPNNFINIPSSGDQLFAYQGAFSTPTLLTGMYNASSSGWDASLTACETSSSKSVLPPALSAGFSAIQIAPEMDNARYDCSVNITDADATVLRAALLDPSNWIGNNDTPFSLPLDCGFSCCASANPSTLFVDLQATGNNDGSSWANAYTSLQDALSSARTCGIPSSIKIAGGTYFPDDGQFVGTGDRSAAFEIDFVTLIEGGYNPTTNLKDPTYPTYLSGNISDKVSKLDNSYQVIRISEAATLSNLTIEHAYNDLSASFRGGGILATAGIFKNLTIRYNEINVPNGIGAGMYASGQAIELENVLVYKNTAFSFGGGISIENTTGTNILTNVTIADNTAMNGNGGLDNFSAAFLMYNSIAYYNQPAGITIFGSTSLNADHCIIDSPNTWPGPSNSNTEPKFINREHDNYRISECWIALNRGNSNFVPSDNIDLDGYPREMFGTIDVGAYEIQREEVRTQIPELVDQSLVYSCPKKVQVGIPNTTPDVSYSLFGVGIDGTILGDGSDQVLTSINDAMSFNYILQGSRTGFNKLNFTTNKRVTIPYDPELALGVNQDFTIQFGFNLNNVTSIQRIYSQEGSFGIGFVGDELIITTYTILDIVTTGVDVLPNTDHVLKIEQRVTGENEIMYFVYLDGVLKWHRVAAMAQITNGSPINIGGRPTSQWIDGALDFLEIKKGNKITLRYDFVAGNNSSTVFDYRPLEDGASPRNGTMVGFTPATDWVTGIDNNVNLCAVFADVDVTVSEDPVNHFVKNIDNDGFESLRFLTQNSCPNDTIRFDTPGDTVTFNIPSPINVPDSLNFVGNGMDLTIWDGNNSGQPIFNIPANAKILMKDLQLTKAIEPVVGAFYLSGDHTLENVLFKGYSNTQPPFRADVLTGCTIRGEVRIEEP